MTFIIGRAGSNPSLLNAARNGVSRNMLNGRVIKRNFYTDSDDMLFPWRREYLTTSRIVRSLIIVGSTGALGLTGTILGIKHGCDCSESLGEAIVAGSVFGALGGTTGLMVGYFGGVVFPLPIGAGIYYCASRRLKAAQKNPKID